MKVVFVLMDIAGLKGIIVMAHIFLDIAGRSKSIGSSLRTGDHEIGLSHFIGLIWNSDQHCDLVESHRDQFHKIHRKENKKTELSWGKENMIEMEISEIETEFDKANYERIQYILRTQQYEKPKWERRENRILRSELKRTGILRFQKDGYEHAFICNLCDTDFGKSGLIRHMKSFHSEILKEKITYLVRIGLLDQSFLNANCTIRGRTKEPPDMDYGIEA
jgi:hypothetical protein